MESISKLRQRLEEVQTIENDLDRRMHVLSVITEACSTNGVKPILVGGAAVEFYTLGGYATGDIDLVMPVSKAIDDIMTGLGFARQGRFWVRMDLDIFVEAPADVLAGDRERVIEVDIQGKLVYIIGIEDIIIDRLNAWVHWKSEEDGRWARRLVAMYRDRMDCEYLEQRAIQEGVDSALAKALRETTP